LLASVDFNTFNMACIAVEAALRSRVGERAAKNHAPGRFDRSHE
jgi:hypothetical protein